MWSNLRRLRRVASLSAAIGALWAPFASQGASPLAPTRTIRADIAAIEQTLVYNRFGSFNPYGMIFALRRDLSPASDTFQGPPCSERSGAEAGLRWLEAGTGNARLKDCKRPRPLVLRANVGDMLHVRLANFLRTGTGPAALPSISGTFCPGEAHSPQEKQIRALVRDSHSPGAAGSRQRAMGLALCETPGHQTGDSEADSGDWPATRLVNLAFQGLTPVDDHGDEGGARVHPACLGLEGIAPGASVNCWWRADQEGTYFGASTAAPAGGEGAGGSITHGLFAAVIVEPAGALWYRSQVSRAAFEQAWPAAGNGVPHARVGRIDYQAVDPAHEDTPILNLLKRVGENVYELVHTDLNAIVYVPAREGRPADRYREMSVFFHDELKTFYTRNFQELAMFGQLAGVRDGFAINYGASGMGTMLLANRKGIGPGADCVECMYEEFFLTSWVNGDPALLEQYDDDPSNVHHSYLNDPVVFRNFHAGPKETHVFHLHAHQWFAGNDRNRGSLLDSQTVAPQQGFSYRVYDGGLSRLAPRDSDTSGERNEDLDDWWKTLGGGNRNRTVGDSIFHCHLYPHFAQGMWSLWRVHDVLEDGSRRLPDAQPQPGLSVDLVDAAERGPARPGSVGPQGEYLAHGAGTPIPAIVPLPGAPAPVLPTYAGQRYGDAAATEKTAFPGYPFYIPGKPGHRPPQAPMDIARALDSENRPSGPPLDGGLGRHVVESGTRTLGSGALPAHAAPGGPQRELQLTQLLAKMLALGDMTTKFEALELERLDPDGTPLERAAMGFHHDGRARQPDSDYDVAVVAVDGTPTSQPETGRRGGYLVPLTGDSGVGSGRGVFAVNGAAPVPGAPYADPCGAHVAARDTLTGFVDQHGRRHAAPLGAIDDPLAGRFGLVPDPALIGFRRFEVSAVQVGLVTNRAGWHDPQGRINVLTSEAPKYKDTESSNGSSLAPPRFSADERPFFFRALSGECIEFRHTNELPKELELDDFQVRTPTDTIGQHIHLVKFDVTSADGSGNGWNYEDGTFAPDEINARLCAETPGLERCAHKHIWRLNREQHPDLFQTTVQRWFADPILSTASIVRTDVAGETQERLADRTLKTVFTHDHFGPSSIQQHGFYSALLIEPSYARICEGEGTACAPQRTPPVEGERPVPSLIDKTQQDFAINVGVHRRIEDLTGPHLLDAGSRDYREFALAIADFATLYDPRDQDDAAAACARLSTPGMTRPARCPPAGDRGTQASEPPVTGLATLACELRFSDRPQLLAQRCGSALERERRSAWFGSADATPAWIVGGFAGLNEPLATLGGAPLTDLLTTSEAAGMVDHLLAYRRMAAGNPPDEGGMARPVNPPQRPESISVDHHDPYLVNYRGEPAPLRLATGRDTDACDLDVPAGWALRLQTQGIDQRCSVRRQKDGPAGDPANLFLSSVHGEPATPVIEAYDNEKVQIRLIQGAQEVQHNFRIEGRSFPRNIDQAWPLGARRLGRSAAASAAPTLAAVCADAEASVGVWPLTHEHWRLYHGMPPDSQPPLPSELAIDFPAWASDYEKLVAGCPNLEAFAASQEIGISEHFEFSGTFRRAGFGLRMLELPASAAAPRTRSGSDRHSIDSLYDFGSLDAIWNGAWGLARVYLSPDDPDLSVGAPESAPPVRKRLVALGTPQPQLAARSMQSRPPSYVSHDIACDASAPRLYAAVAAVEYRDAFGTYRSYGGGVRDRDALFLALVDPRRIAGLPDWRDEASWHARWQSVDRAAVLDLLREHYGADGSGAQPMVLRARAGDCIELAVLNLLGDGDEDTLRDTIGDAPMPRITPFNVGASESADDDGRLSFDERNGSPAMKGLRPSARLALRFSLPLLNDADSVSLPYGWNAMGALAPGARTLSAAGQVGASDRGANIELLTIYAGQLALAMSDETHSLLERIEKAPMDETERARKRRKLLTKATRFIPYAHGPVLVRSHGDVFGHATHGLVGTISVSPRTYLVGEHSGRSALAGVHDAFVAVPVPDGVGFALALNTELLPQDAAEHALTMGDSPVVRSFTLQWRDGLNLRDRRSRNRWVDAGGRPITGASQGGRVVADCGICDDSYDWGEGAVGFLSPMLASVLRGMPGWETAEEHDNFNERRFPNDLWRRGARDGRAPVLVARVGERLVIDLLHPGGRARQHAFTTFAQGYDDLMPGFGVPNAALLGPGKTISASLTRPAAPGCYLFGDGPTQTRARGLWGLIEVPDAQGTRHCQPAGR